MSREVNFAIGTFIPTYETAVRLSPEIILQI